MAAIECGSEQDNHVFVSEANQRANAGGGSCSEVRAVVLETTGDISVLKEGSEEELLEGVRQSHKWGS